MDTAHNTDMRRTICQLDVQHQAVPAEHQLAVQAAVQVQLIARSQLLETLRILEMLKTQETHVQHRLVQVVEDLQVRMLKRKK